MKKLLIATALLLSLQSCGYGNLEYVKENAKETLADSGYTILGYQGYQMQAVIPFTTFGGAAVWYTVENKKTNVTYELFLQRWGDEVHIYSLSAIDAIKPH